ncbi:MAG: WecB/TagA/CpsF family glycosyltransferase [Candidatus Aminicenantes bacterium]|nr:WecB/TagA/CpsF family glycosyltransferase [Candidatus Aminicenantes bacterium]
MKTPEGKFIFNNFQIDDIIVEEASAKIFDMIDNKKRGFVVTPNAAHFLYLKNDMEFQKAYKKASLVLPDGYSLVLASRLLGTPLRGRCTGVELFATMCEQFKLGKYRIFLLGGENGSESKAKEKLLNSNRDLVIGTYSPPRGFENDPDEKEKIIRTINSFEADVMFVFLGSPKSEKFINKYFDSFNVTTALSLGATLDYYSGEKKRAPGWIQKVGFEWFFRLLKDPIRLWKRYLVGNSYFLFLTFKQFFTNRS